MRRGRKDATKVWHNPEITGVKGGYSGAPKPTATHEDRRAASHHRAALEALFAPKREPEPDEKKSASGGPKLAQKIVLTPPPVSDPRTLERQKLLNKLLVSEGRPQISKAATDFLRAGFTFPDDQDVYLKLLEHADESCVRDALESLRTLLVGELPKRKGMLESRLRRIEQFAEESATRDAAERLRRLVTGRGELGPS
jgi:uncharacterized small protein (DUF1192 family)